MVLAEENKKNVKNQIASSSFLGELICTPFTGQWYDSSKGGFCMNYDFVFKLNCVELYKVY